jgi:hypothetical protein
MPKSAWERIPWDPTEAAKELPDDVPLPSRMLQTKIDAFCEHWSKVLHGSCPTGEILGTLSWRASHELKAQIIVMVGPMPGGGNGAKLFGYPVPLPVILVQVPNPETPPDTTRCPSRSEGGFWCTLDVGHDEWHRSEQGPHDEEQVEWPLTADEARRREETWGGGAGLPLPEPEMFCGACNGRATFPMATQRNDPETGRIIFSSSDQPCFRCNGTGRVPVGVGS